QAQSWFPVPIPRLSVRAQPIASPKQSARNQIQILRPLHGLVSMPKRRSKNAAFPISVYPNARMPIQLIIRGERFRQRRAVLPNFLYLIQLVRIILPLDGPAFHYRMFRLYRNNLERSLGLMSIRTDSQQLSPL